MITLRRMIRNCNNNNVRTDTDTDDDADTDTDDDADDTIYIQHYFTIHFNLNRGL